MRRSNLFIAGTVSSLFGSLALGHVTSNYSCTNCHSGTTGRASIVTPLLTTASADPGVVAGRPKFQVVAGASVAMPITVTNGEIDYATVIGGWTSATTDAGVLTPANTLTFTADSSWIARTSGGFFATKGPLAFSATTTQTYNMAVAGTTPADYYLMDLKASGLGDAGLWTQAMPFYLQVLREYTYNINGNGNIGTATNFLPNGVPTGNAGRVLFGPVITSPSTVTINQNVSLLSLTFNNAAAAYTLAGASTITLNGDPSTPAVKVLAGNHVISAPLTLSTDTRFDIATASSLSVSGAINASSRNLYKQGVGTLILPALSCNTVTVSGGTLKLAGNANTVLTNATVSAGGVLDIGSSALIVNYTAGSSPLAALLASRADGRLASSSVASASLAIGSADTAQLTALTTFNGTPLDSTTLVFVATLKGDTNLDKSVTFDDLLSLAQNYDAAGTGKTWTQGDSDYSGAVNFDDLLALAQNYGATLLSDGTTSVNGLLAARFESDLKLALSMVPEPGVLLVASLAGLALRRRR